jgi:hypothetical protein
MLAIGHAEARGQTCLAAVVVDVVEGGDRSLPLGVVGHPHVGAEVAVIGARIERGNVCGWFARDGRLGEDRRLHLFGRARREAKGLVEQPVVIAAGRQVVLLGEDGIVVDVGLGVGMSGRIDQAGRVGGGIEEAVERARIDGGALDRVLLRERPEPGRVEAGGEVWVVMNSAES